MGEWFAHLDGMESMFLLLALGGGVPLIIMFILQFFLGGGHSSGVDDAMTGAGTDVGHYADPGAHGDLTGSETAAADSATNIGSALSFKFLSFQGVTAFFTMFGLVGFALYRQSALGAGWSIAGAFVAGLASVWVISRIFALFNRLQSSGTIETASSVNCLGEVYMNIPASGSGKVMVTVQGRLREYDAVSADDQPLKTGARIIVVRTAGTTLVVKAYKGE